MNNKCIATVVAACLAAIGAPSDWTLYDYSYGSDTVKTVDFFSLDRTGFATWNSETFYDDLGFPNYVGEALEQHVDQVIHPGEFGWLPTPLYSSPLDQVVDQMITPQLDVWAFFNQVGPQPYHYMGYLRVTVYHNWNRNEGEFQHWKGVTFTSAEDKRQVVRWDTDPGWLTYEVESLPLVD